MKTKPDRGVYISMVIPAYNEAARLWPTLSSIVSYFRHRQYAHEIIVVDDGSQDDTVRLVREAAQQITTVRLICLPHNTGKGAAVRAGVLSAIGDYIIYNDADGATPVIEIERLLYAMAKGADVAIGSRALPSPETHIERKVGRAAAGRMFAFLVNLLAVPGIADTQCGFKMFRHDVACQIFERQQIDGFAFDVEVLRLAAALGYRVDEIPINWTNIEGSKVTVGRHGWRMLWDVMRIRYLVPSVLDALPSHKPA